MATFTKSLLSGSTNGKGIKITTTASAGDTIHTASSGTSALDEVWLWATNEDAAAIVVTLQYGGTTAVDNSITVSVPPGGGLVPLVAGLLLQNSLVVKAFAGTANKVVVYGFVNKIA
jgi:hypothetical protein